MLITRFPCERCMSRVCHSKYQLPLQMHASEIEWLFYKLLEKHLKNVIVVKGKDMVEHVRHWSEKYVSYGILLCEVTMGQFPLEERLPSTIQAIWDRWAFMHSLITACIQEHPDNRPTMSHVLTELNKAWFTWFWLFFFLFLHCTCVVLCTWYN